MPTRQMDVRGTKFYSSADYVNRGQLYVGCELSLENDPRNRYDKNAVKVLFNDCLIGHVPKEDARFIGTLNSDQLITEVKAERIQKNGNYYDIYISVSYEQKYLSHQASDLLSVIPAKSGVYVIKNTVRNWSYVGQSENLKKRISSHLHDLNNNRHHNSSLQDDYNQYGVGAFAVEYEEFSYGLDQEEKNKIATLYHDGAGLYNPEFPGFTTRFWAEYHPISLSNCKSTA